MKPRTILTGLASVTIRGLSVGKWVHKSGGALMLTTFAMLLLLPWLELQKPPLLRPGS